MIKEQLNELKSSLPEGVTLVAVSKTKPKEMVEEAYQAGQRIFGENRIQELVDKYEELPKDIQWHAIGHLQTNKVKYVVPFVSLIHAVDSFKLLKEINKQAAKIDRRINCLLQFHIAQEESKHGLTLDESIQLLDSEEFRSLRHVSICGVMGMATFTNDENQVRSEFKSLKTTFERLKGDYFNSEPGFCEISMGMSGDFQLAVTEGSTMIRVGSKIFGARK